MTRCKKVIGQQRVTFRSLVEEGLCRVLDDRLERKPFKLKSVPFRGGGFQPGGERDPAVPLEQGQGEQQPGDVL